MPNFYFVVGNPLSHTLSPQIYNAAFFETGLHEENSYFSVDTDNIEKAIELLRTEHVLGCSVTSPYKEDLFHYLDINNISAEAKEIVAINVISKKDHILFGHNTDWIGFLDSLKKEIPLKSLNEKNALVIGSGGAARAIIYALKSINMNITVLSSTKKNSKDVYPSDPKAINLINSDSDIPEVDMIINATPLGMKGTKYEKKSPICKRKIKENMICIDLIYNPISTKFLNDAKDKGAKTINGIDMLIYQATHTFKIWTGKKAPIEAMRKACKL